VNPKVDEQSMMTYLSQFPNAKLKDKAPVRPQTNAARVKAYGPGKQTEFPRSARWVTNFFRILIRWVCIN